MLLEFFEEANKRYNPGDCRHYISMNPETGLIEFGLWTETGVRVFQVDQESEFHDTKKLFDDVAGLLSREP